MVRKRIVGEAVILCLKHIAEGGEELLIVGLETDVGGVVEVWGIDEVEVTRSQILVIVLS